MAQKFKNQIDAQEGIKITNELYDGSNAAGTSGQVLSSTGTGTQWIDSSSSTAERIEVTVKNVSGGSLSKGTVVHAAPTATPPSGNVIEVIAADYDTASAMPAIGVLNETIANEAEGAAVMMGAVSGIDTDSFNIGDELYVGNAGAFTNSKPTANNQLIQKMAVVIKKHASNGLIKIFGAGRSNDVPNQINRNVNFTDDSKLTFGDSTTPDLEIYHDGSNSHIDDTGTGNLVLRGNAAISLQKYTGENLAMFNADGGVDLYHDDTKKFETTSTGVLIDGAASTDGIVVQNPLSGSLYNAKLEFKRDTTSGGVKIQTERNASGGVGLSFNVTADNTAEVNGTYTTALTIAETTNATFAGTIDSDNITVGKSDGNNSSISLTANTGNWTFTNVQSSRNLEISDSDGTGTVMTIDTSGNTTFAGNISVNETITSPTNTNLKLQPNGTGHLYLGDSSNGFFMYHYSNLNDGVYTTFSHNSTQSVFSTTGSNGFSFGSPITVSGNIYATGNIRTDGIFVNEDAPDGEVIQFIQSGRKTSLKTFFASSGTGSYLDFNISDSTTNGGTNRMLRIYAGDAIFYGDVILGNTISNPATGFADQSGIGLQHSSTIPKIEVSSDAEALSLNRTTTGGDGVIADFRYESNSKVNIKTNKVEMFSPTMGTYTKLGVAFDIAGSAANLSESVNYSTVALSPLRSGSSYGMYFGNANTSVGYIQLSNTAGNATGSLNLQPYGGSVGIGRGFSAPSSTLHVVGSFRTDLDSTYNQGILNEYVSTYVTRTKFGRIGTTSNLEIYYDISGTEEARITRNYTVATLKFMRGSTTDLEINGSGKVGVGASPSQAKLDILNNGDYDSHTGHGLAINSNTTDAYTSMYMGADDSVDAAYIQSAGKNTSFTTKNLLLNPNGGSVGIGNNTSPNGKLEIKYDMDVNTGGITTLTSGTTQYGSINFSGAASQGGGSTGTTMQGLTWQVNDYGGTTDYGVQAQLVVGNNGDVGTFMGFFTSDNYSNAPVERLRIDSAGSVGVGGSPDYLFHVIDTSYAANNIPKVVIRHGTAPSTVGYDTMVISAQDVPTLVLTETDSSGEQKLSLTVGDNKAVIGTANTSAGMYFNVARSTSAYGYDQSNGIQALHLSNDGNATFAGNVNITDTSKIFFYSNENSNRYIHASSTNDLTIASDDDINYLSNYNRFYNGASEFARLSGSTDSWIARYGTRLGVGTSSPSGNLHIEGGQAHNNVYMTTTSNAGTGYDVTLNMLAVESNSEVNLNMGSNSTPNRESIRTYQSQMTFRTNSADRFIIANNGYFTFTNEFWQWTALGAGTYNKAVLYYDSSNGWLLENSWTTDSVSGSRRPITLTWRGGIPYGGLKLTGSTQLYTDNTGFGINRLNPSYLLDVYGQARITDSSNNGILYLGETGATRATRVYGRSSPSYSSTGKLQFDVTTWGAGSDYGPTEQMNIEVTGPDTKKGIIRMLPNGGDVIIGGTTVENPNSITTVLEVAAAAPVGLILNDTRDANPLQIENRGAVMHFCHGTTSQMVINDNNQVNIGQQSTFGGNNAYGVLRVSDNSQGLSTMAANTYAISLGPKNTRNATANNYYAGITWNGLMNYAGSTSYDAAPHIWLGAKFHDFPGSERSKFCIGVKSGSGTTGTGNNIPVERLTIDYSGTLTMTGDIVAFSDGRLKDNVKTIESALDKVNKLRGVSYVRNDIEDDSEKIGVIAQEVIEILPQVVKHDISEDKYSVAYGNMAGVFIEAIKELTAKVEALENKKCNCK